MLYTVRDAATKNQIYSILLDITIIAVALVISGTLLFQHKNTIKITIDTSEERYLRPIDPQNDLIFGNPEADLFVVEYGDLECPYCKEFHPNMKEIIKSSWGVSGKVAWVWRNGFHINLTSIEKAKVLECVRIHGGERSRSLAWRFIEESLIGGTYEQEYPFERYKSLMERIGIPFEKIEQCRKDNEPSRQMAAAAYDVGELDITDTPYIQFVSKNGDLLFESVGALTSAQIEEFIGTIFKNTTDSE